MSGTSHELDYKTDRIQNLAFVYDDTKEGVITNNSEASSEVHFEIEEYDFDTIVSRLLELEGEHGMSSTEMFFQYIRGTMGHGMEEWVNLFVLYLGTHEVRQFSCP